MKKNRLTLRSCATIFGFLLLATAARAEAFRVLHFHSDITLNVDGSFDVTEDILLDFSESKHGFLRKLPYRYGGAPNVQGEIAAGHRPGQDYLTPITDISVEGREFTVTKGLNDYDIKIGSADVYVTGRQRYRIHYKVYGAINFFSKNAEFYWNVNGNDWEVDFDTLDATVHLPDKRKFADADLQVFTGRMGDIGGAAAKIAEPGAVQFLGTRRFGPGEGMTISLRMPKGYLRNDPIPARARAEVYLVDSLHAHLKLLADGAIDVLDSMWVEVVVANQDLKRTFWHNYAGNIGGPTKPQPTRLELLRSDLAIGSSPRKCFSKVEVGEYTSTEESIVWPASDFTKAGKYLIVNRYRIWGATVGAPSGSTCFIPYLNLDEAVPMGPVKVDFAWQGPVKLDIKQVLGSDRMPADGIIDLRPELLTLTFRKPFELGQHIHFGMQFPGRKMTIAPIPMRVLNLGLNYRFYHVDVEVRADGSLHIANRFAYYQNLRYTKPQRPIRMEYNAWQLFGYGEPASNGYRATPPQHWGILGEYLVYNLVYDGEMEDYSGHADHQMRLNLPSDVLEEGIDTLEYSYDIYGMLRDTLGTYWLELPIVEWIDEPADHVTFTVKYPGGGVLTQKDVLAWVDPLKSTPSPTRWQWAFKAGEVQGELVPGMANEQTMYLRMALPPDAVHPAIGLRLQLLWRNHKAIFFPFILFIPLFVVWFIWGRDKRFTTVVEFYPPEDLTPAEAGMLIDDKLQNRDLLALIYYWGAQGNLVITEVYDKDGKVDDYKLEQRKKLPATARKYERTIYNALFKSGKITKVSSHKMSFYTYMASARAELNAHVKSKQFYVPGTQGWATGMRIAGWILALVAIIAAGLVLFEFSSWLRSRWEIPVAWAACAGLLFGFARIMPKKAGFGQKQYQKLKGFHEFVLRAEKDKLEELVNTNPDYFGMTLPYAIALGIATQWVDQFGDLLKTPPTYYNTNNNVDMDQMRRTQFMRMMQRQLDTMAASFNSSPPSSGGGGGGSYSSSYSSSSSSSSSSYSSSGSSGGSSYSSGGGYSGGGYGGGGGSSW